eukprot:8695469-Pyramimonas_sp.AAC.1
MCSVGAAACSPSAPEASSGLQTHVDCRLYCRNDRSDGHPASTGLQARQEVTGIDRAATITCTKECSLAKVVAK